MARTAGTEAAEVVGAARDDPDQRLDLATRFYDTRPRRGNIRAYRRAEIAFMHWQLRRGVLAAPSADPPGIAWWRAVNEHLIRDTYEATGSSGDGRARRPAQA